MTKVLKKFTVFMMVILCSFLLLTGPFFVVSAEEITEPEQVSTETETTPETPANEPTVDVNAMVESFVGYLKEKYGDDYQYFII